jgi:hypothetical protein
MDAMMSIVLDNVNVVLNNMNEHSEYSDFQYELAQMEKLVSTISTSHPVYKAWFKVYASLYSSKGVIEEAEYEFRELAKTLVQYL